MIEWAAFAVTVIVSASLMMHMSVIALQAAVVVIESIGAGGLTRRFFYPALVQNIAVVVALIAFSYGNNNLALVAVLLLALAMQIASGRPHPTYRQIELPLVLSGLASLVGIALIRLFS